jgi:ABC-type uncharacterized transport system substrate-binding protein
MAQAQVREVTITKTFMEGMRDLGYFEGENIQYVLRSTERKIAERTGPMVAEFIAMGVDVVLVASGQLAKEMIRYTSTMPIVMGVSPDPVADGIVSSLARPRGNVTGYSLQAGPELEAKRLQLLKEIAPTMVRVAYLATKKEWDDVDGKAMGGSASLNRIPTSLSGTPRSWNDRLSTRFSLSALSEPFA